MGIGSGNLQARADLAASGSTLWATRFFDEGRTGVDYSGVVVIPDLDAFVEFSDERDERALPQPGIAPVAHCVAGGAVIDRLPWVTFSLLLLHVMEELLGDFPAWATAHFGTTTLGFYIISHIPLIAGAALIARQAASVTATAVWRGAAVALQGSLAANGIFHIASTLMFGDYSPGLLTSVFLYLPFTVYFFWRGRQSVQLPTSGIIKACVVGAAVALLLEASLILDIDFI